MPKPLVRRVIGTGSNEGIEPLRLGATASAPPWSSERHDVNNWRNSASPAGAPNADCREAWAARSGAAISALSLLLARAGVASPVVSVAKTALRAVNIGRAFNANFAASTQSTLILATRFFAPLRGATRNR
jgi:hypothetical protein